MANMDESSAVTAAKYQKLASEYSKLKAQANVLKKAVLEEQAKGKTIREQLRERETALRRCEQEVDSLSFRNNQLEHRVAALQEELAALEKDKSGKKKTVAKKDNATMQTTTSAEQVAAQDVLIFDELQKKIMENAKLTTLIDDRERDLKQHADRIAALELSLKELHATQLEAEKRHMLDMDSLCSRNAELESKLLEARVVESEEQLNAPSSSDTINQTVQVAGQSLEREVAYWRTQYEIAMAQNKAAEVCNSVDEKAEDAKALGEYCNSTTAAAGLSITPSFADKNASRNSAQEKFIMPSKEQLMFNCFSEKFEELLYAKCISESRGDSFGIEVEYLQNCLENASYELKVKDELVQSIQQTLQMLEDDLSTTRLNYDEQISVLTEQVINLSDQLAACK